MNASNLNFIAFDLETTGLYPELDKIIEVGAVKYINGQVDSVFSTLVDPEQAIPAMATKINGITNDMVKGKPLIQNTLEALTQFCQDFIMVAHNATFDFQFLQTNFKRCKMQAPNSLVVDTYGMAKKIVPGLPNYKLGTLVQHFNIQSEVFHRAEDDAKYCAEVFMNLVKKVTGGPSLPPSENLISLSGKHFYFAQLKEEDKQTSLFDV
ncbi:MAG: 3'-5' exonuclease [Bdellovibrionaceae bacterium]|nr:3'-5' exonuclease [Pseudobdellovibrionaceae bacterium]